VAARGARAVAQEFAYAYETQPQLYFAQFFRTLRWG
jgi:hypothetical protein